MQLALAAAIHGLLPQRHVFQLFIGDQQIDAGDVHVHDASGAIFMWPTSLLPIWPSGRPTYGPEV